MRKTEKKLISIDDVLIKAQHQKNKFIAELEREDSLSSKIETIDSVKNEILADRINAVNKKFSFINEIKSGLGDEIKQNKGVIIIKKPWYTKLKIFVKKIFTRF